LAKEPAHVSKGGWYSFGQTMLLMRGSFVNSKVKSGRVQELSLAVVLNRAALVTMTLNRLVIRARALRS
jgi:hypothetical protein